MAVFHGFVAGRPSTQSFHGPENSSVQDVWPHTSTLSSRIHVPQFWSMDTHVENTSFMIADMDYDIQTEPINQTVDGAHRPYLSPAEWATHRQLISRLYLDEDRPLREVRDYMKEQHNFIATENMYKKRIKKWGLDKKFKRHEAIAMLALLNYHATANNTPILMIRGRIVNQLELRHYARRAGITNREMYSIRPQDASKMPGLECRLQQAQPHYTEPPDCHHTVELLYHELRTYLYGAFDSQLFYVSKTGLLKWPRDGRTWRTLPTWHFYYSAMRNHQQKRTKESMLLWRKMFLSLESLINFSDPRAWLSYLDMQINLRERKCHEISLFLNRHMVSMVAALLRNNSPHHKFVTSLCKVEVSDMSDILPNCHSIFRDICTFHTSTVTSALAVSELVTHIKHRKSTKLDLEPLYKRMALLKEECIQERNFWKRILLLEPIFKSLQTMDMWAEAREICEEMVGYAKQAPICRKFCLEIVNGHKRMGSLSRLLRQLDRARSEFQECLKYHDQFEASYGPLLSVYTRYACYRRLDHMANRSNVADGDPQWRLKYEEIEKQWEETLAEEVETSDPRNVSS